MPEEEPIKGNLWTKHAVELLSNLGWELKGDTNVDIPCTMHPFKRKGQSHGIDAFMTYFDPYQNIELGIIIETKNYAWKSINAPFIQESFNKLVEVLGCVPYSEEFNSKMNFNNAKVDTALLMVWAHDEFDKLKFEEYLKELQVPKRHKPLRVYIVNNYDILKLYSIVDTVKKITDALKQNEKFDIYYPSYLESDSLKGKNLVSLEYIFSKFIFFFRLSFMRCLIFSAAFLVKVIASTSSGLHRPSFNISIMLFVKIKVLPEPAQAITRLMPDLLFNISSCCSVIFILSCIISWAYYLIITL